MSALKSNISRYELNNLREVMNGLIPESTAAVTGMFVSMATLNLEQQEKDEESRIARESVNAIGDSSSIHAAFKEDKRLGRDLWVSTVNRKRWLLSCAHIAEQRILKLEKELKINGN